MKANDMRPIIDRYVMGIFADKILVVESIHIYKILLKTI